MTTHIVRVEWAVLEGRRPRHAGSNARLGEHGITVRVPLLRLTDSDGAQGFGVCRCDEAQARSVLGRLLDELFSPQRGTSHDWLWLDYPLWDLMAKRAGQPVYTLAAKINGHSVAGDFRAPCYDTSLYFDDLHLDDHDAAAALMATEARQGFEQGHRAFKIKVGRGARHMPLEAGTQRDIAVVRAVQEAVGMECPLMLDANNGYNLNLTKQVLDATSDCNIFWMEEAFQEDPMLYRDLKEWLASRVLNILIADGEGWTPSSLLDWAREKLVDVIQYDIFGHGFTRWLATGKQLDYWGARSAPHHYGGHYGNFATCHLAGAIAGFTYVEFDAAATPGLDTSGYSVRDGFVRVPATPGFGIELDEAVFQAAVRTGGFSVE